MSHGLIHERRPLNEYESRVLLLLTSQPFEASTALTSQLDGAYVAVTRQHGFSVDLGVDEEHRIPAPVRHRVPIEAEGLDIDGSTIHFLLFVDDDSLMSQLEIYRDDGEPVMELPDPATLTVPFVLG
jgi:hypothetical protein